jgi:hypothetical protein
MIMTLQKPEGIRTERMEDTLRFLLDQLNPEDNPQDDTDHYKEVKRQVEQPINIPNDKEFTQEEVKRVIVGLKEKKAPGPNGITNEVVKLIFKTIPNTITLLYNECLRKGSFPAKWKIAKVIPITKTGKEVSGVPSK